MPSWTEHYRVRASELDADRQLDSVALCDLLQETAGRHAGHHGIDVYSLLPQQQSWVLSRLRLRRSGTASWRDALALETWARGTEKLLALRDYELRGPAGVVARASSAWLLIDVARRRPLRPFELLEGFPLELGRRATDAGVDRLPALADAPQLAALRVQPNDLDANRHVNNVRYVAWALQAVREAHGRTGQPAALDIDFIAEALGGDAVQVCGLADGARDELRVQRGDGTLLARARLDWGV